VIDAKRKAPAEAKWSFDLLRAMLRWAVARGDLDHNPIDGMREPPGSNARERVLSDDEIRTLWNRLPEALVRSPECQRIIKLCLVTGQRVGEVAGMAKGELDLKQGCARSPQNCPNGNG
jgi:integrase